MMSGRPFVVSRCSAASLRKARRTRLQHLVAAMRCRATDRLPHLQSSRISSVSLSRGRTDNECYVNWLTGFALCAAFNRQAEQAPAAGCVTMPEPVAIEDGARDAFRFRRVAQSVRREVQRARRVESIGYAALAGRALRHADIAGQL